MHLQEIWTFGLTGRFLYNPLKLCLQAIYNAGGIITVCYDRN